MKNLFISLLTITLFSSTCFANQPESTSGDSGPQNSIAESNRVIDLDRDIVTYTIEAKKLKVQSEYSVSNPDQSITFIKPLVIMNSVNGNFNAFYLNSDKDTSLGFCKIIGMKHINDATDFSEKNEHGYSNQMSLTTNGVILDARLTKSPSVYSMITCKPEA